MRVRNETFLTFAPVVGRVRYPAYSLTIVVKGTYAISDNGTLTALPVAQQPHPTPGSVEDKGEGRKIRHPSDMAYFKPAGEVLVRATAHAPDGGPVDSLDVGVRVGDAIDKTLRVYGRRRWQRDEDGAVRPSIPTPFDALPIVHEHAFGGPSEPANPVGTGAQPAPNPGFEIHESQLHPSRIEYPSSPLTAFGDKPTIAALEPIEPEWEPRRSLFGTMDANWRQTRAPWLPEDLSWLFFCEAPADQVLSSGYFKGDEVLTLKHLHPTVPNLTCPLPGHRVRCAVAATLDHTPFTREVPVNLDTIFVDMGPKTISLVWRGLVEVDGPEFACIEDILIDLEEADQLPLSETELTAKLDALIATPSESETSDEEAEAELSQALTKAVDDLRAANPPKEIMDLIDSGKDPLEMVRDLEQTIRRLLKEAGVDVPPTP